MHKNKGKVGHGILMVYLGHFLLCVALTLVFVASLNFSATLLAIRSIVWIGLVQLIYVIPLAVWCYRRGQTQTLRGVVIGALITLMLNSGCYILLHG